MNVNEMVFHLHLIKIKRKTVRIKDSKNLDQSGFELFFGMGFALYEHGLLPRRSLWEQS